MEYNIVDFVNKLKEWFVKSNYFPYMSDEFALMYYAQTDKEKHPKRTPTHLRDVAKQCMDNTTIFVEENATFDYGNVVMETNYPHYHILENSPIIRKRNRGTEKSKGSQAQYKVLGERDYERVKWSGKTFTKEYSKNVRGSRKSVVDKSTKVFHINGMTIRLNKSANSYRNIHYRYIENVLENDVNQKLCDEFGLKMKRKENTGFGEEYSLQEESNYTLDMVGILNSFDL